MAAFPAGTPPSPPAESPFHGIVQQDDLFEVIVDDGGTLSFQPAVVWSVCDNAFEVFFLTRCHPQHPQATARGQDQLVFVLEDHFTRIPWEAVNAHVPLSDFEGSVAQQRKRAFKTLGFRDLGSSDRFYKVSEEALLETVPALRRREAEIGELDSDSDDDSDDDSMMDASDDGDDDVVNYESLDENGNLKDLVAPEDEVELFTEAPAGSNAFVDDMHRAQAEFGAWQPSTPSEQRNKDLIDRLDGRIRRAEANRAWARGRAL